MHQRTLHSSLGKKKLMTWQATVRESPLHEEVLESALDKLNTCHIIIRPFFYFFLFIFFLRKLFFFLKK